MSTKDNDRIDELQAVVVQLGNALTLSERRTSRLERMIRWGSLTMTLAAGLGLVIVLQPYGFALAQQQGVSPSQSVEEAIDRLSENLTGQRSTLGGMGMMMNQMLVLGAHRAKQEAENIPPLSKKDCEPDTKLSSEIKEARINNQLGFYAKCYFVATQNEQPSLADYQQVVISAVTGTAVDLGVLVARVRDDSDVIREFVVKYIGDSEKLLEKIGSQLETLNGTLTSVPHMTASVTTMTHQMGIMAADMNSMTHSMGTSMGRMGKWMPW